MKSPKEDYEIRKIRVSDPGIREDLLNFLSFYKLVIYHVITTRSSKCTSKVCSFSIEIFVCKHIKTCLNSAAISSVLCVEFVVHTVIHKGFKGTVVNRALYSLYGGSLKITLTVL